MSAHTLNQRDIDFLLYEFLDTEGLLKRPRYSDHSRESFDAIISGVRDMTCRTRAGSRLASPGAAGGGGGGGTP